MAWTLAELAALAEAHQGWVVRNEVDCLCVVDDNGLEAWVAISGEQIIVETVLFGIDQVSDQAALNDQILRTHQLFPLTTIAISTIDHSDYYVAFGALSSQSQANAVELELIALFDNVSGFLDAYGDYLG